MARIDLPARDGLEVGRALALVPHFAAVAAEYEKAVARSPLDRRLHELVRMRIAQINECTVCMAWRHDWGATEAELAAVAESATSPQVSAADQAALEYAERFC
nr:carboxymuconolactone decarboxylase family protein [Micromonospora sp. DSM 115978]